MLFVRAEMWDEFEEHMTYNEFDLMFREAVSRYETGT
jgi:hypothetical protein